MLTTGRYKGNPMAAHMKLPIEPHFFERWLALWQETAGEVFAPEPAAAFRDKASRIAESLKLGLFYRPGRAGRRPRRVRNRERPGRPAARVGCLSSHACIQRGDDPRPGSARARHKARCLGLISVLEGGLRFRRWRAFDPPPRRSTAGDQMVDGS